MHELRPPSNTRNRRAFTLVELLLASALLTVLMVGILAIIADFGTSQKALRQVRPQQEHDPSTSSLEESTVTAWSQLLRDDLRHARTVDCKRENHIVLVGYCSLSLDAGPRSHRPVQVEYLLENIDGHNCLFRRQMLLDVASNQNVQRDLVAHDVQRFVLGRTSIGPAPAPASGPAVATSPASEGSDPGMFQGGSQWCLRVWGGGGEERIGHPLERTFETAMGGGL